MAVGHLAPALRDALTAWRVEDRSRLRARLQRAIDEGDLPSDSDPDVLARYLMTTADGIAVQAASGAGRDELPQVADAAFRNWPVA